MTDQSAGTEYSGTLNGGATIVNDAQRGDVLSLDGDGDSLTINSLLGQPANVTIAAWVNLSAADTNGSTVMQWPSGRLGLRLDNPSGNMVAFISDGTTTESITAAETVAGTGWRHVAFTFDNAGDIAKLYLDGVEVASESIATSITYSGSLTSIGGLSVDGYDFNGLIDDARVYSRALSADEIVSLANDSAETADTIEINVLDSMVATSSTGGGLSINADGGNDAYLVANDGGAILGDLTKLTLETRFTLGGATGDQTLISYTSPTSSDDLRVVVTDSGNLSFKIGNDSATVLSSINYHMAIDDGNEHTLALTWSDSGALSVYLDGEHVETVAGAGVGETLVTDGILVFGQEQDAPEGGFQTAQSFNGTLHDIRIFSDVRTASEIVASYRSDLPYDEPGMIANWKFDQLSTDGVVLDAVSGNNLTLKHTTETGFTASEASLTLRVDESALDGTVVGSVAGNDLEREQQIQTLLDADPNLRYSAETGKFYKFFQANESWSDARDLAVSQALNGASGQLVTIRSAFENELVHQLIDDESWLGGTDATVEGEWRWLEDGSESDLFWNGNGTGYAPSDVWANWSPGGGGQPNGNSSVNYFTVAANNGTWWDKSGSDTHSYVVEWNADDVLDATQAITYLIQSQSVAGAFEIDASTGEIRVADGTLLDADTLATHTITVRTADSEVTPNTVDKVFTITLNNLVEDNNTPTDLSSGIELNTDGGNDAYFSPSDGEAVVGGLQSLTAEFMLRLEPGQNDEGFRLLNYSTSVTPDEFSIHFNDEQALGVRVGGDFVELGPSNAFDLHDGQLHHVSVTWDNTNGDVRLYVDGKLIDSDTGLGGWCYD